jgi:hypothetical protein
MKHIIFAAVLATALTSCSHRKPSSVIGKQFQPMNFKEMCNNPMLFASDMEQACRMRDSMMRDSTEIVFINYAGARPKPLPQTRVFLRR